MKTTAMKRTDFVVVTLALTFAACGGGSEVGSGVNTRLTDRPTTASPTPTVTRTRPTSTATRKATATPTRRGKIRTWELTIRNVGEGFEPDNIVLNLGDKVHFTNRDPQNRHSFVAKNGEWESPPLDKGEDYTLDTAKAKLKTGQRYDCRDGEVPYIVDCFIQVV